MDVPTLESSLDDQREGYSGSFKLLYPTRGQWLPYKGLNMEKLDSFPSLLHLRDDVGPKHQTSKKVSHHEIVSKCG